MSWCGIVIWLDTMEIPLKTDAHPSRSSFVPVLGVFPRYLVAFHPTSWSLGWITTRIVLKIPLDSEMAYSQSNVAGSLKLADGYRYHCDILWSRMSCWRINSILKHSHCGLVETMQVINLPNPDSPFQAEIDSRKSAKSCHFKALSAIGTALFALPTSHSEMCQVFYMIGHGE